MAATQGRGKERGKGGVDLDWMKHISLRAFNNRFDFVLF